MWHPWRALRRLTEVDVHWTTDLPEGVLGATDGSRIWMDSSQLQAERRCTIAHELEHVARGHTGCVSEREEVEVRRAAARRLVKMQHLLAVAVWTESLEEAADELWVDVNTLLARLAAMTPEERAQVRDLYDRTERGL